MSSLLTKPPHDLRRKQNCNRYDCLRRTGKRATESIYQKNKSLDCLSSDRNIDIMACGAGSAARMENGFYI